MSYKQVVNFNLSKMGTKKGYCLMNVRQGFGIAGKNPDAKSDMLENKNAGTLHPINTLPTNVCVPVYADTTNVHEHIMVSVYGDIYSDGKKVNKGNYIYFGWGEMVNGIKVVEKVGDDEEMKIYKNGSTPEDVYSDTNLSIKIGSLNPRETCDCYGEFNGRAVVRYKVDGTNNYKIGFCKWLGGIS